MITIIKISFHISNMKILYANNNFVLSVGKKNTILIKNMLKFVKKIFIFDIFIFILYENLSTCITKKPLTIDTFLIFLIYKEYIYISIFNHDIFIICKFKLIKYLIYIHIYICI